MLERIKMLTLPDTDRRTLFKHALWLIGASAVPKGALAAAVQQPGLEAARFALLSATADTIIPRTETPGAMDVGVPKLFDEMLRKWASSERRATIIASLDRIGTLKIPGSETPFVKLTAEQRYALLEAHDKAALTPAGAPAEAVGPLDSAHAILDPHYGRPKQDAVPTQPPGVPVAQARTQKKKPTSLDALLAGPQVADMGYAKLKELVIVLYYFSEPALTQELRYEHAPGQWVPSIPIIAETRAWGGVGVN